METTVFSLLLLAILVAASIEWMVGESDDW